ncbi:unnamed protein product [Tilletia controversa]|uniref:Uncharacterized protein n=3 Tax=Tilletia TaxID=13289 RepID=A0A8X7N174_9BASI|nr:hypothetical protein CF336_g477 [Tilletia laevis]KAE8201104.1 hypothetical protein CF328_g2773 [Tilletia controversa]KAE8265413.1 hypothetical protein A4X03_0g286 [Tilletia caries]KAE8208793.1 hypothetical protein CF335_g155 [Tilletia laevis]KAE8255242.1 hypothetical protein A4X06_0g530 [Tilletia controversa]
MLLRPTLRLLAQQVYKPSMRFPDRSQPKDASASHEPHAHPAAPPEIAKDFNHFKEVYSSGPHFHPEKLQQAASTAEEEEMAAPPPVAEDLHELPPRFWRTSSLVMEEDEMEAIMTGGASTRSTK